METKQNNSSTSGILEVVTIVFVILKLTGVIDWSWWIVFSPILVPITIGLVILLLVLIFMQE